MEEAFGIDKQFAAVFEELRKYELPTLGKEEATTEIEIEMRYGRFVDTNTDERVAMSFAHPVIIKDNLLEDTMFKSGVSKVHFNRVKGKLEKGGEGNYVEDSTRMFKKLRYEFRDNKLVRVIKKINMASYVIAVPDLPYDIRLSVNKETLFPTNRLGTMHWDFVRDRRRTTFYMEPFEFAMTEVETHDVQYEIEIELKKMIPTLSDYINIGLNLF